MRWMSANREPARTGHPRARRSAERQEEAAVGGEVADRWEGLEREWTSAEDYITMRYMATDGARRGTEPSRARQAGLPRASRPFRGALRRFLRSAETRGARGPA